MRPIFKSLGLTWRGLHSARRSAVTEMRAFGKPEDVVCHFGHTVEVADEAYDKGRMPATREAAQGYYNALAVALAAAKSAREDSRGQAN